MFTTVGLLIRKDLVRFFRNKQFIFYAYILPLMIMMITGLVINNYVERNSEQKKANLIIVDNENSIVSRMLIENFKNNKEFSKFVNIDYSDTGHWKDKFQEKNVTAVVEIPEEFSKSIYNMQNKPINIILSGKDILKGEMIRTLFNNYSKYISVVDSTIMAVWDVMEDKSFNRKEIEDVNQVLSFQLVNEALGRGNLFNMKYVDDIPRTDILSYYLISIIVFFAMYISIVGASDLISERKSGCADRIKISAIGEKTYFICKFISITIIVFTEIIILLLPLYVLKKNQFTYLNIGGFTVLILMIVGFSLSLIYLISEIYNSEEEVAIFTNLTYFVFALIGGNLLPIYIMPTSLDVAAKITPNYHMIKGLIYVLNGWSIFESNEWIIIGAFIVLLNMIRRIIHRKKGLRYE